LLPPTHFEQLTEKQQTRLAVNSDAEAYLAAKQQEILQKLTALQESIGNVEGTLILDEKGYLHLPQLEKAVPEEVERLKKRVYALLPHLPLADLLLEVDAWTGFLRHFTHLTSKDAPVGTQKLEQTAFLLEYFRDEALKRRILVGLNKGEALHALAHQLLFGRLGELRDRAFEDQMHRASCLHLIMAAIAAWNTVYLTEAIATLRKRGEDIPEATVAHIAPLGWEHIHLIGNYHFAPPSGRSLENLRPLRLQGEEESA